MALSTSANKNRLGRDGHHLPRNVPKNYLIFSHLHRQKLLSAFEHENQDAQKHYYR